METQKKETRAVKNSTRLGCPKQGDCKLGEGEEDVCLHGTGACSLGDTFMVTQCTVCLHTWLYAAVHWSTRPGPPVWPRCGRCRGPASRGGDGGGERVDRTLTGV